MYTINIHTQFNIDRSLFGGTRDGIANSPRGKETATNVSAWNFESTRNAGRDAGLN